MKQISGFGMKNSLSLPSLGWKFFFTLEGLKMMNLFIRILINICDIFYCNLSKELKLKFLINMINQKTHKIFNTISEDSKVKGNK